MTFVPLEIFGSEDRLDYTTVENGVELASRLESNANVNQNTISEDTYLLIKDEIVCDKLGEITVKNIRHPIQTYEVRVFELSSFQKSENSPFQKGFSLFLHPDSIHNVVEN